jgi:hypothetical protein
MSIILFARQIGLDETGRTTGLYSKACKKFATFYSLYWHLGSESQFLVMRVQ